jgi:hypothetical protein
MPQQITNRVIYDKLADIEKNLAICSNEISHLPELKTEIKEMRECVATIKVNVGKLEVKSGIWGAIAGFVTAALALVVAYFRNL